MPSGEGGEQAAEQSSRCSRYLERSLELVIDLLAQLPTRRFFHAVHSLPIDERRCNHSYPPTRALFPPPTMPLPAPAALSRRQTSEALVM